MLAVSLKPAVAQLGECTVTHRGPLAWASRAPGSGLGPLAMPPHQHSVCPQGPRVQVGTGLSQWLLPAEGRQIAANMRGIGVMPSDIPEWKKHAFGGNKASYGKKTQLSIVEQREGLPIYRLKGQLVQVGTAPK